MTATKECTSCGSQNDVIFTNCIFCKTALPQVDQNSISNEDLIMKASEWVGKSSEPMLVIEGPDKNEWTGKGIVKIMQAEIIGNAEKYLNLLAVRAMTNPTLAITYQDLKIKLEKNSKSGSKKKVLRIVFPIILLVVLGIIIGIMSSKERNEEEKEINRLDKIELQINDAIKNKDYDNALILTDQLVWRWELQYEKSQRKALQYDKQRENLKQSILKFKEQTNKQ